MSVVFWRGDAPAVAQITRIRLSGTIVESSVLRFTINGKSLDVEAGADNAEAILQQAETDWNASEIAEFAEITAAYFVDLDGDPYLDLTADTAGKPFTVTASGPFPAVDVDTIATATTGNDEVQKFYFSEAPDGGTFTIAWDLGGGTETSDPIAYDGTAEEVLNAMVANMASVTADNMTVTGSGTMGNPFVFTYSGSLGSTNHAQLSVGVGSLTISGSIQVDTIQEVGGNTREVQMIGYTGLLDAADTAQFSADGGVTWTSFGDETVQDLTLATSSVSALQTQFQAVLQNVYGVSATVSIFRSGKIAGGVTFGSDIYTSVLVMVVFNAAGDSPTILSRSVYSYSGGGTSQGGAVTRVITSGSGATQNSLAVVVKGRTVSAYTGQYTSTGLAFVHDGNSAGSTFSTTGPTISDPTPAQIEGLASIGAGQVSFWSRLNAGVASGSFNSADSELFVVECTGTIAASAENITDNYDGTKGTRVVVVGKGSQNEKHQVYVRADGGTFTLSDGTDTTSAIAYNASTATIVTRLETDITAIGAGDVSVTGAGSAANPWVIEYIDDLAGVNVADLTGDGASLTNTVSASASTVTNGGGGTGEKWRVTLTGATGGTFKLKFRDKITAAIAYNAAAATVQTELQALSSVGSGNMTVSGSAGGPYTITAAGTLSGIDHPQIVSDPRLLTGTGHPTVTTTEEVASSGPEHADNPVNYSGGALPSSSDILVFRNSANSCRYGLNALAAVTLTELIFEASYTGEVGLPTYDVEGSYYQYRDSELQVSATAVYIGRGDGEGSALLKLNLGSVQTNVSVLKTGTPTSTAEKAVTIRGTHAANVIQVVSGSVDIAPLEGTLATFANVRTGFEDDEANDVSLRTGSGVTLTNMYLFGGDIEVQSDTTLIQQRGGTLTLLEGAHTAIDSSNALIDWRTTGEVTNLTAKNTIVDLSKDPRPKDFNAGNQIELYGEGAELRDPLGTLPSGVDIRLNMGNERLIVPGGKVIQVT